MMNSESSDPKETKQLTGGDKIGTGLLEKVREDAAALKERAIEEAKAALATPASNGPGKC